MNAEEGMRIVTFPTENGTITIANLGVHPPSLSCYSATCLTLLLLLSNAGGRLV